MGLRLDWGKALQDNRHSIPTRIPIPGPTLSVAGGGGGSNTTHALLSPDPETLPIGEVSRPATGEFLRTKVLQGQRTVAPYAPLTAGSNSSLSQRYGPAIIPQELVAENLAVSAQTDISMKNSKIDPLSGPARGRDEATDPMPFAYELPEALTQPGSL